MLASPNPGGFAELWEQVKGALGRFGLSPRRFSPGGVLRAEVQLSFSRRFVLQDPRYGWLRTQAISSQVASALDQELLEATHGQARLHLVRGEAMRSPGQISGEEFLLGSCEVSLAAYAYNLPAPDPDSSLEHFLRLIAYETEWRRSPAAHFSPARRLALRERLLTWALADPSAEEGGA